MVIVIRKEQLFQNTCLQIPYDLKQAAKEQGINMTQVLVEGIKNRLKRQECAGVHAPASSPGALSPKPKRKGRHE
jgi:hypothetical protein